jgi:hypothetical protein
LVALGFFVPPIPSDRLWVFAALGMMSFDPVSYPPYAKMARVE